MAAIADNTEPTVAFSNVDWEQYEAILAALGGYHLRHTYDDGRLEIMRTLHGVAWSDYVRFLDAMGDQRVRHIYDGWTLEMMSPRKDHDRLAHVIGRFIEQMTIKLHLQIQSVGSMTISDPVVKKGVQPDQAYYITHEPDVAGKSDYEPGVDPPPDLAVEVDVTNSSVERFATYAALGIPEIWHHDGRRLRFLRLNASASYDETETSGEFPWLASADVALFLEKLNRTKENDLTLQFAEAAATRYAAWRTDG